MPKEENKVGANIRSCVCTCLTRNEGKTCTKLSASRFRPTNPDELQKGKMKKIDIGTIVHMYSSACLNVCTEHLPLVFNCVSAIQQ